MYDHKTTNFNFRSLFYSPRLTDFLFVQLRRVPVPDARFDYLCEYYKPLRYSASYTVVV